MGAEGSVDVLENGPGGLALVTFETGRVVDWRWIKLAPGHNALSFPVPDALAPDFALQVAHQRRGTYRQAQLDFEVRRELTLSVKPQSPLLAPGAACVIDVEVLDVLGKPVAAELSLAVVDEALFELYEDRSPDLAEVFRERGSSRESAVASSSSCAFSYQAATWEVSGEVLAEARRVEEELQWKSDRAETAKLLAGLPAPGSPSPGLGGPSSPGPAGASDEFFLGRGGGAGSQFGGRKGRAFGGGGGGGTKDKSAGPEPLDRASPTAYWTATLTTDASGKASVTFPAPQVSSRWRVAVHGAARDPRAESSTASFTTRADFFVELVAPAALAEGDRPRFFARLFNTTDAPLEVELELGLRGAGLQATLPGGKLTLAPGTQELAFGELPQAVSAGLLELSLTARARAGGRDLAAQDRARISVGSFGVEYSAGKSGVFSTDAEFALELPRGRKYSNLSLELFVGPDLDGLLVDEALGLHPHFCLRAPETDGTARAADLLGAAEVLGQLARTGRDSSPDHARVRERTAALASVLLAAQDEQRGWTSSWRNSEHETELTAYTMLALASARDAGIALAPECGPNGVAALERMQRATGSEELRALVQHALSRWDRADYGALNRLHRLRAELSNAALAHSALALSAMDRKEMAGELAELLAQRAHFDAATPDLGASWGVEKNLPGSRSPLGTAAFAVLALEACAPRSPALERGVQYLLSHRPWFDPRARGVALAALARHQGTVVPASERCEVTAAIGGAAPRKLDPAQGSLRIPVELADNGKLALRLALTGRGRPHFVAILRGFSAEGTDPRERRASAGEFQVLAPAPLWRGRPIQVGFSSVREFKDQWVNRVGSLPRGDQAWASISFTRPDPGSDAQGRDWLLLDVPFPAGARAREATIQGGIAAAEVLFDRIVAYVPPDTEYFTLQFRLEGAVPGRYRVGPSVMRRLSTTEVIAVGKAREFEILPLGGKSADPYRATPDELYGLGMAAWGAGQHDEARTWLSQLMKDYQAVLADESTTSPLQEAAGALFFLALEADDAAEIVRWFEVLREKRPDQVIPFDRILAVAQAYSTIDEHERALSILRASVGETFGVDLKVAGAMEAQGDVSAALALLARLWSEYPDAPPVLETWLALSDKLLTLAPRAPEEASLVRDGRSRAGLHLEGTRLLQLFLCLYPRDPQAPEAALNLISAHLGLEDYETVSSQAAAFAARYATPDYADAFLYSRAVAEWYLGHDEEALRVCERVASAVWRDAAGVERPSKNRELAQYILAQIHHARREVERAAEYYQKVESSFADARAALAGLREKRLSMGEVTRARPGEAVRLELASKNVPEVELAIYPVDLMTLYLREADLAQVSKVELSGIAPELTQRAALGPGNTLRESKQVLDLALPRTGAYLALARGGELFATGLILVSDLDLDVAEDAETGLVRVQVVDSRDGKYVRDVDVRVVGSEDKHIQRAKTDLRGMASLDAVQGLSTVIARSGEDRYAFYRGSKLLGNARPDRKAGELKQQAPEQLSQEGYLKNVFGFNELNQSQRAGRLSEEIDRQRLGVQINQVK